MEEMEIQTTFNDESIEIMMEVDEDEDLLDDMMDTLHATSNGAALAAPQIGILKQLVVVDMDGYVLKMINPKIITSEGLQDCIEGCLSFPNRFGKTVRPEKVTVEYLDENGTLHTLTGEKDLAKCFCHELDHLNGEVFIDKVTEFLS